MKIETLYNNAHPPLRGGIPVWAVGWVDVGIDPYDAKQEMRRFFNPHTIFQYRL